MDRVLAPVDAVFAYLERESDMSRHMLFRLIAGAALVLALPLSTASTAAAAPPYLERLLAGLWTKVFQRPVEDNPFTGGDSCLILTDPRTGKPVLAPFAPSSPTPTCTVPFGTKLLVTGWSSECRRRRGSAVPRRRSAPICATASGALTPTSTCRR